MNSADASVVRRIVKQLSYTCPARLFRYFRRRLRRRDIQAIKEHYGADLPKRRVRRMAARMRHAFLCDGWDRASYLTFHYDLLSRQGRKAYLSDIQKDMVAYRLNSPEVFRVLDDKMATYARYGAYFRRDLCQVSSAQCDRAALEQFLSRHKTCIVKPNFSSCGEGVQIVRDATVDSILRLAQAHPAGVVLEELIEQGEAMAAVYPLSVNTVRLHTVVADGRAHILRPIARFGRGGNIVDNGARGGLLAAVDLDTGVVTYVCDTKATPFVIHPDTGVVLPGLRIPCWEEAKQLALELAAVWSEARYVGWDLAYTDSGWVLVEGNSRGQQIGQQLTYHSGIVEELEDVVPGCLKPWPAWAWQQWRGRKSGRMADSRSNAIKGQ